MSSFEDEDNDGACTKPAVMRKDGIGENEKGLYPEGAEKYGNDWKKNCHYIAENGQNVLPTAVFKKYIDAESDKEKHRLPNYCLRERKE
ncbi:hypothetical protein AC249_AIPGENE6795 [Exaiptasia diaphana]|nr:hypothetical protein AC249_AIPGENE6795 [Exaiptasia diaphana]